MSAVGYRTQNTKNNSSASIADWTELLRLVEYGGREATREYVERNNQISETNTGQCILALLDATEQQTRAINAGEYD